MENNVSLNGLDYFNSSLNLSSNHMGRAAYQSKETSINLGALLSGSGGLGSLLGSGGIGSLLGPSSSNSGTSTNPLSIVNIINGFVNGNPFQSATNLANILTPFLSFIPLDLIFPNNTPQANLAIISSLPQFIKLIEFFNNFQYLAVQVSVSNYI